MFYIATSEIEHKTTKEDLYLKQIAMLKTMLEHGAITDAQYIKSSTDLADKMGFAEPSG